MKYKLAVEPGSTRQNKTGTWRNQRPVIDPEKCVGCGKCVLACPEGCIYKSGKKNSRNLEYVQIDYDYCKGCGLCHSVCPFGAITMVDEDK